ncbi:MarR family transcriptional regulator [Loktanella sp. 3ANDIMAR09]|uniref:MarR family winged helix-turn-helix transcriptional regulator n=1 Tax=Loktanella sp. 3ANDIMAR09 TaxID=1225657 RepID=UPI0006F98DDA|nr:MarR family transcriptional regulator [Loktanella sp. 3ANDIMAR09]KQI70053.1 MarR family transcriptional regulator [Loktanella sp. 3ANDIMAR09]
MTDTNQHLAVSLFSELLAVDQLVRHALARVLPKGMELSHFSVLNHLAHSNAERSPTQLAQTFHLTRGAMTNTLTKLEWAGYIHIRPDWDDARKKMVSISPAGRAARDAAIAAITPLVADVAGKVGEDKVRAALPLLRELRVKLSDQT